VWSRQYGSDVLAGGLAVGTRLSPGRLGGGRRLLGRRAHGAVPADAIAMAVTGGPRRVADAGTRWGGIADA